MPSLSSGLLQQHHPLFFIAKRYSTILKIMPPAYYRMPPKMPPGGSRLCNTSLDNFRRLRADLSGEKRKPGTSLDVTGLMFGAACLTRTDDLSLTRRLLYQLS